MCRTPKCNETLKSDGHAKVWWSAPNPNGLARQSLMVHVHLPKPDGVICKNLMVLIRLVAQILFSFFIIRHNQIVIANAKENWIKNKEEKNDDNDINIISPFMALSMFGFWFWIDTSYVTNDVAMTNVFMAWQAIRLRADHQTLANHWNLVWPSEFGLTIGL